MRAQNGCVKVASFFELAPTPLHFSKVLNPQYLLGAILCFDILGQKLHTILHAHQKYVDIIPKILK